MQNKQEPTLNPEALKWHKEQMAKSNEWWNQKLAKVEQRARTEGKTVYQCSCCGFRSDGVLRIHDCEWTNSIKIKPLFDAITPPTTNERAE